MTLNRIHLKIDHSLILHNVSFKDRGFYFCNQLQDLDARTDFAFHVDGKVKMMPNTIAYLSRSRAVADVDSVVVESGNITTWRKYQDENLLPVNRLFVEGNGADYVHLREGLGLELELKTSWDGWGECEVCGRPQGEGIRRKIGHCRVKIRKMVRWSSKFPIPKHVSSTFALTALVISIPLVVVNLEPNSTYLVWDQLLQPVYCPSLQNLQSSVISYLFEQSCYFTTSL